MSSSSTVNPSNVATPPPSPTSAPAPKSGVTSVPASDSGSEVQPSNNSRFASSSSNGIQVPLASVLSIESDALGARFDFRSHERVKMLLQIFAEIQLVSVRATISVDKCFAISVAGVQNHHFRHGLAPRSAPTHIKVAGASVGTAGSTPRLVTATMNPMFPVPSTAEYTSSTFPPGMQVDLRAVETRHPYVCYLFLNDKPTDKVDFHFNLQLDFIVECSGENFGVVGL